MYELSDLFVLFFCGFCLGMEYGNSFGYDILLAYIMAVVTIALTIYSIAKFVKRWKTNINDEKDNN